MFQRKYTELKWDLKSYSSYLATLSQRGFVWSIKNIYLRFYVHAFFCLLKNTKKLLLLSDHFGGNVSPSKDQQKQSCFLHNKRNNS